ncbi:OTU domain-containing protein 4 isoform X2 [Protopterus annectens]|nr:OTU domain-containing protein 4 isoform X2 [Protopterus annectens]
MLCFSNGNHYDIVYPEEFKKSAAVCQSLLYEILYEKVFGRDISTLMEDLTASSGITNGGLEENPSVSGDSGSDSDDDVEGSEATGTDDNSGYRSPSFHQNPKRDVNTGNLVQSAVSKKVLQSLNPTIYRNIEYEVWLKSKHEQQKLDYTIAAGMQFSVGDKCMVRLDNSGRQYNAHIQEVNPENGQVMVFVEELGEKHSVSLKNLKPPSHSGSSGGWNRVTGKKVKKSVSTNFQNSQSDSDFKSQKGPNKPLRNPTTLPPRLQQTNVRQPHFAGQPTGSHSQHLPDSKPPYKMPPQSARKAERERSQESDSSRQCNYFGLSPEERREKQAIEESRALFEIQQRDEQAFPALSPQLVCQAATQTSDLCIQKSPPTINHDMKSSRSFSDPSKIKDSDCDLIFPKSEQKHEASTVVKSKSEDTYPKHSSSEQQNLQSSATAEQTVTESGSAVTSSVANSSVPLPLLVSSESQPTNVTTPAVPSAPSLVQSRQSEPVLCKQAGLQLQTGLPAAQSTLLEPPSLPHGQIAGTPIPPHSLPVHAVNQPLMPLPQTMNSFADPLYPGFPLNEKGECVITPPYSISKTGDDLPQDKGILRFFFNLGIKAYSCPMWAPHSYLYPLHQTYFNTCRIYPKVPGPTCHLTPWIQDAAATQSENAVAPLQTDNDCSYHNDVRPNVNCAQVENSSPVSMISLSQGPSYPAEISGSGLAHHSCSASPCIDSSDKAACRNMFPHAVFGHNAFFGALPIAPSFFPPVWFGYPIPPLSDSHVVQHNLRMAQEKHLEEIKVCPTSEEPKYQKEDCPVVPVRSTIQQHEMTHTEEVLEAKLSPAACICNEAVSKEVPVGEVEAGMSNESLSFSQTESRITAALSSVQQHKMELKSADAACVDTEPQRSLTKVDVNYVQSSEDYQVSKQNNTLDSNKQMMGETTESEYGAADMQRNSRPHLSAPYYAGKKFKDGFCPPTRGGYSRSEAGRRGTYHREYNPNYRGRGFRNGGRRRAGDNYNYRDDRNRGSHSVSQVHTQPN